MENRTFLEVATLIAVARLEHRAYGVAIREDIEGFLGQPVSLASVYVVLQRLTRLRWLRVSVSAPLAIPGGRAKRIYQLTDLGRELLLDERRQWTWLWGCLPRRLSRSAPQP
jgi:DNA-binding PadR family transcriptional regulator